MSGDANAWRRASFFKHEPFRILEVSAVAAPDGGMSGDWYRYVVSQGGSPIEGFRQGTKDSVTAFAEEFVTRLNERRCGISTQWATAKRPGRPRKNVKPDE